MARPGKGEICKVGFTWDKQDNTPRTRKIPYLMSIPRVCAARAGLIFGNIFLILG